MLLAACATQSTTFTPVQPSSEKGAAVYVYRASHVSNIMLPPEIKIKDAAGKETTIGRLNYGEYKLVYLEPGSYQLTIAESQAQGSTPASSRASFATSTQRGGIAGQGSPVIG